MFVFAFVFVFKNVEPRMLKDMRQCDDKHVLFLSCDSSQIESL